MAFIDGHCNFASMDEMQEAYEKAMWRLHCKLGNHRISYLEYSAVCKRMENELLKYSRTIFSRMATESGKRIKIQGFTK